MQKGKQVDVQNNEKLDVQKDLQVGVQKDEHEDEQIANLFQLI